MKSTEFKNVVVETVKTVSDPERGRTQKRVRPTAGRKVLKMALDAMNEGHTVSMRTHYDDAGTEYMDVEIMWDGQDKG